MGLEKYDFADVGFRVHSQNNEDGILHYIFSLIGTTNKKCIEICVGDGLECNTTNLVLNQGWNALMFDGDVGNVKVAKDFFRSMKNTKFWIPIIINTWITRDNINKLISENNFNGEIDLLSLDIDGIDYWLWEAIDCISPRVVVLEFNHLWGADYSVSVPYSPEFKAEFKKYGSDYAGASLPAFVKLGKTKGYRLVGINNISTNAFFIREDINCPWLPEEKISNCFKHPRAQFGINHRLPKVSKKKWVEIK
jgi:hypothetical protein